jgi:hypothetical protein
MCWPRTAHSQLGAFTGEAVDAQTLIPVANVAVSLVDMRVRPGASTQRPNAVLRRAVTDVRGLFQLPHEDSGVFRLRFDTPGKMPVFGPTDTVAADSVVERRYKLAFLDASFDSVFTAFQVDREAEIDVKHFRAPHYPGSMEQRGIEGVVALSFVIDTLGRAELGSVKMLLSTHEAFYKSVIDELPKMRFIPATFQGRRVRQLAEQRFEFAWRRN